MITEEDYELLSCDASKLGALGRACVYEVVEKVYGLESNGCLSDSGATAYRTCILAVKKLLELNARR